MADPSTNPYLALLQQEQQPPGWAQILQHIGNLGFGLAGGFGQAATTGQPTMAGIGPGLMLGNQMNAQAAHQAEQERMKRLELQFQAQAYEDKRADVLRKQKALEAYTNSPGFNVAPPQGSLMGPSGTAQPAQPPPDIKTAGAPLADYLVAQHGLSPLAASTIVGNLYQESGFNPAATGDSGSAFGMAQWRLDRQTGLRNFAATQSKPVTDPQVQIDYLVSEMKGGDMGAQRAWAGLQQAKTPEQANAAMMHFFRPAGYTPANPTGGHGYGQRVANTRALLPQGGPSDSTYAPVPTVDPYAVSAPPAGPAPRPGLGPRATPGPGGPVTESGAPIDPNAPPPPFMQPAPDGVPLAQGGGEGEVVLPRLGLPFPARPPAAAPPGSVPFPAIVQPNYTPTPGQPSMTPGGGPVPAPAGGNPPPVFVPPQPVGLPPEFNAHVNRLVGAELITPAAGEKMKQDYGTELNKQVHEAARAQHTAQVEIWKQREQVAVEQRKIQAQVEAEQRAIAEKEREHARGRKEKGAWVRGDDGIEKWVAEEDIKPGMVRRDKPPEPPAPGTAAGDDHILSTAPTDSVEYKNAFDRKASEPKIINGQAYVRDMSRVPPPTYGQPAGAPAAAPAPAPAAKSDIPGMTPVGGGVSSTEMANLRIARTEAETLVKALEDFKQEFKKAGTMDSALSLGGSNTPLNTSYNVAALLAKGDQLFKLGVLSGPDLDIIRRTLPDPSTIRGAMTKTTDMEVAVDKVTGLIEAKLRAHEKNLGVEPANIRPAPATQSMQPKTGDLLEGRTATGPNGQKVIRQNGQWVPVP